MPTMSNKQQLWWFLVALVYMTLLENSLLEAHPQIPKDTSRLWREQYQHIDRLDDNHLLRPNSNASSLFNRYLDEVMASRQQRRQRSSSQLSGGATKSSSDESEYNFFGKIRSGKIGFDLGERKRMVPPPPPLSSLQKVPTIDASANANANVTTTSNTTNALVPFQPIRPKFYQEKMEVSVSVDPSSFLRLVVVSAQASASFANAFFGTLRLVAPMIVARRFLSTVGYLFYDHYTGRYIRTTYNRRLKHARLLEFPAVARGLGRTVIELACMAAVGRLVQTMLTTAPCWMTESICHWWFGMMWMLSVLGASRVVEFVMAKYPPLQIETVDNANPRRVFTRPWHLLQQWLRDPEEWISNMAAYNERIVNRDRPFQPDPLLFPSTWPPLRFLIYIAVVRVMTTTLWDPSEWGRYGIMREFLLQHVLYDEWYRILMKEKRVALAAVMHASCFLSTLYLFYTAMLADGLAPVLIFPALLASMFSGWMNIVLYWERLVERQQRRGRRRRDFRGGGEVEAVTLAGARTRKVAENKKRLNMEWLY